MDKVKEVYAAVATFVVEHPKFSTFAALIVGGVILGALLFG